MNAPQSEPIIAAHRLSLVVPLCNEGENIAPLLAEIHNAMTDYAFPWEVILVNDGSSDDSLAQMREQALRYGAHVRIIDLQRNFGQTAATQAGIDAARGDVIATLDGDLQNDPHDIPRMVKRLLDEDLDMLVGWRKAREDGLFLRRIPSTIANRFIRRVTGVDLHDYGCSLKIYRADIIKSVRLYGEMHRFIPAWVATRTTPARIREEIVTHHARRFGASKYGISRAFRVILDLLAVYFFMRFRARPGHFFGSIGLGFGALGTLILGYLLHVKFLLGEDIGNRPLLLVGVLFIVVSVQFLTTGVLSELIARTYFESGHSRSYEIRNHAEVGAGEDEAWKTPL